jgi:8-amino-7-oxononanoate synthase
MRIEDPMTGLVRRMIMLGSNSYLGLATHPHVVERAKQAIDRYGCGMGGPPLLNGTTNLHRELELALARLKHAEDAMLFPSGYQTNLGWILGLVREGDCVLYDALSHASLHDGLNLLAGSRKHVETRAFRHNDVAHLERTLEHARAQGTPERQIFVACEGVYSMDGDLAPIPELRRVCNAYGAILVVDDAHGTGVLGASGGGTAEHFEMADAADIAVGTFSKAFSITGGFIAGKREVITYLRFFSRPYMFSAHVPPSAAAAVLGGLEVIAQEPERIERLRANARYLSSRLTELGFAARSASAIIPVLIPEGIDIRAVSQRIHEEGVFVNSVEFPAVAKDAQRLRVSVMATHTREDLDEAIGVFAKVGRDFGIIEAR